MEKTIKLVGKYNTISNTYNKARVYFSVSGDMFSLIQDIYLLGTTVSNISINGSERIRTELAEMNMKGNKISLTFEMQTDEKSLVTIAKYAFDRTVTLEISYNDEKALERVSNAFYSKIVKTMQRMTSALGMATIMELHEAINMTYGYSILINKNMYLSDAEQLYSLLEDYAREQIPDFDMEIGGGADGFVMNRMERGLCIIDNDKYSTIVDGLPLCETHAAERMKTTREKFKAQYNL